MGLFSKKKKEDENLDEQNVQKNAQESVSKSITQSKKQEILEAQKIFEKGMVQVRDIIAPSALEIKFDHVRLENKFLRTYYVTTYPRYVYTNWLAPIINYDASLDIAIFISPLDSQAVLENLKKKVGEITSQIRIEQERGKPRDPTMEYALHDVETLRDKLSTGVNKFFQVAIYFTLYADSLDALNVLVRRLETNLGGNLIYTKPASLRMEQGFTTGLPLGLDQLDVRRNMDTEALSTVFPFSTADLTQNQGILYGINRHNNSLVLFDRFQMENANMVVFAKSGAGKSYAVKLEAIRQLMFDTEVIIIDPEREYKLLAETLGGAYIEVSLNSNNRINPFDLPRVIDQDEGDPLRSAIINMHAILKLMFGEMDAMEESILDKALMDTYSSAGITSDPSTHDRPMPTMENLQKILAQSSGGQNMAIKLEKYTTGSFAGIFNKPTNVDIGRQLIVFDIRDLEDVLRPIGMHLVLNFIWNKVKQTKKRRILIVDEAWILMQHKDSAQFMFSVAKRARKYWLGLSTITQDVNDFLGDKYGKAIVTNSSIQLLLKQSPAAIDLVAETFNLTQGERMVLLDAEVGTGLFFAGLSHVAIHILPSYLEHQIITTNPNELAQIKRDEEMNGISNNE
ncbi:MAG: hypothetical protein Fur0024_0170 [Patescibacteria group bacterium]